MSSPENEISAINELVDSFRMEDGHKRMHRLLTSLDYGNLMQLLPQLKETINGFYPKRRRQLALILEARLRAAKVFPLSSVAKPDSFSSRSPRSAHITHEDYDTPSLQIDLSAELRKELAQLSDNYIFQWGTFYRDTVGRVFGLTEDLMKQTRNPRNVEHKVKEEFARHASEIFGKGFKHSTDVERADPSSAISKSLAGLQRFLELPLEVYSARVGGILDPASAKALRGTCSAIIAGILEGFGSVPFGDSFGWKILPQFPRLWAHYLGFLTGDAVDQLESQLSAGSLRDGIRDTVIPVARAIDQLIAEAHDSNVCVPGLGQFLTNNWRLEISLLLPASVGVKSYLDIHCYLRASSVDQTQLTESANRGVSLIAAPLRPDLYDWMKANEALRAFVVNTSLTGNNTIERANQRALEVLSFEIDRFSTAADRTRPLRYNFARDFPLHNPVLNTYFHVQRTSVRNLLRVFERRNGVRLWCSVRRSGKTTATFDLGATTGSSIVITQTCDNTDQLTGAGLFYERFTEAISHGHQISASFFQDTVDQCLQGRSGVDSKLVFVLDEYETLFERMGAALRKEREIRYTVIQPLLNQMVAFSRQNLLILIGQRPDAHYIIMDQNQLSPYVEQDKFPLFDHTEGSTHSEFYNLISKVLTNRVTFDDSFVNEVYLETGGHPWLTVNLLVDFFDWMIQSDRRVGALNLTSKDFETFAGERLTTEYISTCAEYGWFRQVISEALSEYAKDWTPWLHAVYVIMRRIIEEDPEGIMCSRSRFSELVRDLRLQQDFGYTADYILSTATPSNFLWVRDGEVLPRIRLMARISLAAHPRVAW
ncbi:MAG TPA: hypothetical protein VF591_03430 [Pyrinomonadaceae bacterium]|jgi:hypothetical protein